MDSTNLALAAKVILQAYFEGKVIQSRVSSNDTWADDLEPTWNFSQVFYRVKPPNTPSTNIVQNTIYYNGKKYTLEFIRKNSL